MYWTMVFIMDFFGELYSSIIVEAFFDDMPANSNKALSGNFSGYMQYTENYKTEAEARKRLFELRNMEG